MRRFSLQVLTSHPKEEFESFGSGSRFRTSSLNDAALSSLTGHSPHSSTKISPLSRAGRLALETKIERRSSFQSDISSSSDEPITETFEEFCFETVNLSTLTEGICLTPSNRTPKTRLNSPSDQDRFTHYNDPKGLLRNKFKKQCTPQDFSLFLQS